MAPQPIEQAGVSLSRLAHIYRPTLFILEDVHSNLFTEVDDAPAATPFKHAAPVATPPKHRIPAPHQAVIFDDMQRWAPRPNLWHVPPTVNRCGSIDESVLPLVVVGNAS